MGSLVSIGTAAKELGVHPATLRRWEEGKIDPPERTTGGDRRYDLAKLHQPSNLARADAVNELSQSTLLIIETRANIGENFIRPKLCCAKTFEKCHLASEVVFLAGGRYPSIGQSCSG